jgi:hypothetical protein
VQCSPEIAWCTRSVQVVRGAEDRVVRIVHVAPQPVPSPRRRHELHRALGARCARAAELAELRLDEVHRSEDVPLHAESALRLPVVREQHRRGRSPADLDRARRDAGRQTVELTLSGEEIAADTDKTARQPCEREPREPFVAHEQAIDALLVQRVEDDVLRRPPAGAPPTTDRAVESGRRLRERGLELLWRARQRRLRRRSGERRDGQHGDGAEGDGPFSPRPC